jgi:hypothetical protein
LENVLPEVTHPRLRNLLTFWETRRGERAMPAREALDPLVLREWLGHLMLIEAVDDGQFRYRVYGTGLAEYLGRDLTGKTTAVLRSDVRAVVCQEYATVCRTARPLLVMHTRRIREQPTPLEKLILPFSSDGRTVDRLLAGAYPAARG